MLNMKALAGFFGRFLLFFTVMLLLWPIVGATYGAFYRSEMNAIFGDMFSGGVVSLELYEDKKTTFDTQLFLDSKTTGQGAFRRINSYQQGYLPMIYLIGLVLATPIPWPRRLQALLWGLVIINMYIPLRLLPALLISFSHQGLGVVSLGAWSAAIVEFLKDVIHVGFAGHFVVPIPIWFLLCIRRGDIARILAEPKKKASPEKHSKKMSPQSATASR